MRNKYLSFAVFVVGIISVGCSTTTIRDSVIVVGQPDAVQPERSSCRAVTVDNLEPIPASPVALVTNGISRDMLEKLLLDYAENLKRHDKRMREEIVATRDRQLEACTKSLR